jgi:putative ABC transport system substrate-binding protein
VDRLPILAADLVRRPLMALIVANSLAAMAAKAATTTIPIVFVTGDDPVRSGLVANLSRPDANLTGVTFFANRQLSAKRLELLYELVPNAAVTAVLLDPNWTGADADFREVETANRALGRQLVVVKAGNERELDQAFARMVQAGAGALFVGASPVFTSLRRELVALAARYAIPASYDLRDYVAAGGLISYSASITDAYRQAGLYASRILQGTKPVDLPVIQPTKFELVINLRTAKTLGLTIPPSLLAGADEVIE